MFTDPLLKVLGPGAGKYLNFEMFDYDGENLRNLKEDLIGRIGIEAIFIFGPEIICGEGIRNDDHDADLASWLKIYGVICSRNALVWGEPNKAEYDRLADSE